jgi:excisionase family DNA binding protein
MAKMLKNKLHPRDPRSPRHSAWKGTISAGIERSNEVRVAAGFLPIKEVAEALSLPVYTVRQMVQRNQIQSVLLGARRFVLAKDVDRWANLNPRGGNPCQN